MTVTKQNNLDTSVNFSMNLSPLPMQGCAFLWCGGIQTTSTTEGVSLPMFCLVLHQVVFVSFYFVHSCCINTRHASLVRLSSSGGVLSGADWCRGVWHSDGGGGPISDWHLLWGHLNLVSFYSVAHVHYAVNTQLVSHICYLWMCSGFF